jgi:hypothetical protein
VRQVINAMGSQIEQQQDNNGCLAYWLSNTVTLLYLLQRNIKPASGGTYQQRLRTPTSRYAASASSSISFSFFDLILPLFFYQLDVSKGLALSSLLSACPCSSQ